MLVANLTRPVIDGVSVRVIGIWLGLQFSKTDDKCVNANGGRIELTTADKVTETEQVFSKDLFDSIQRKQKRF